MPEGNPDFAEIEKIPGAGEIRRLILHNPQKEGPFIKIKGRKVTVKNREFMQFEKYTPEKVFHENAAPGDVLSRLKDFVRENGFTGLTAETGDYHYDFILSSDGGLGLKSGKKRAADRGDAGTAHNREKNYLIKEGTIVEPLIDMGVFTREGKIAAPMYGKFKQINRFLEIVNGMLRHFPEKKLNVVDFGCGKSYLTFIVYYFLKEVSGFDVTITGVDLKDDVIAGCNETAKKYGYDSLRFQAGGIEAFVPQGPLDLVMSLHACDTATDQALYQGLKHGARGILAAPCCHHELNGQMEGGDLPILVRHGVVRERMAALFTDLIRANLLEAAGYKTRIMEFVDLEHTPKNLLIRGLKTGGPPREAALQEARSLMEKFHLDPALYRLLFPGGGSGAGGASIPL
jgi:SAM-dependent methyltransferase